jgi:hypothetical protein
MYTIYLELKDGSKSKHTVESKQDFANWSLKNIRKFDTMGVFLVYPEHYLSIDSPNSFFVTPFFVEVIDWFKDINLSPKIYIKIFERNDYLGVVDYLYNFYKK